MCARVDKVKKKESNKGDGGVRSNRKDWSVKLQGKMKHDKEGLLCCSYWNPQEYN